MAEPPTYLITGAGGGVAGISPQVVTQLLNRGESVRAMVHHDDARADALRAQGAEVVAGDLTNPVDVFAAMSGITRAFFNMSVSPDYLQATTVVCVAAEELGGLEVLVNMSQMTVSQMTATSTEESEQQRLHWLAEHVINWSGVPAVHIRPTVLLENPLFDMLAARSIRATGQLALPFGTGRTSPVASSDVADVVTAVLTAPHGHLGAVYELTGPATLNVDRIRRAVLAGPGPSRHRGSAVARRVAARSRRAGTAAARGATHRHHGPPAPRGPLQPLNRHGRTHHRPPRANGAAIRRTTPRPIRLTATKTVRAEVRAEGFEPSRSFEHRHLKPARMPFRHARSVPIVPPRSRADSSAALPNLAPNRREALSTNSSGPNRERYGQ